jgi:hypothetical protein
MGHPPEFGKFYKPKVGELLRRYNNIDFQVNRRTGSAASAIRISGRFGDEGYVFTTEGSEGVEQNDVSNSDYYFSVKRSKDGDSWELADVKSHDPDHKGSRPSVSSFMMLPIASDLAGMTYLEMLDSKNIEFIEFGFLDSSDQDQAQLMFASVSPIDNSTLLTSTVVFDRSDGRAIQLSVGVGDEISRVTKISYDVSTDGLPVDGIEQRQNGNLAFAYEIVKYDMLSQPMLKSELSLAEYGLQEPRFALKENLKRRGWGWKLIVGALALISILFFFKRKT